MNQFLVCQTNWSIALENWIPIWTEILKVGSYSVIPMLSCSVCYDENTEWNICLFSKTNYFMVNIYRDQWYLARCLEMHTLNEYIPF